jgi:ABC-type antimicrobial peptide transport system permease subunit
LDLAGVTAHSVSERTREIGIRLALGAQREEVVGMIIRQEMVFALAGIVLGVAGALGLTRLMASLLYDVKPNDLVTFTAASLSQTAFATLACLCAAVKAANVDPAFALRHEGLRRFLEHSSICSAIAISM